MTWSRFSGRLTAHDCDVEMSGGPVIIQINNCAMPTSWGKNSKRAFSKNGKTWVASDPRITDSKLWLESHIRPMAPTEPLQGPVIMLLEAAWPMPKSAPARDRKRGWRWKSTRPDFDAFETSVLDVLQRCRVIEDDAQVCAKVCRRVEVSTHPFLFITLLPIGYKPMEITLLPIDRLLGDAE